MAARCRSVGELSDFLAFVVLYAPDHFPAFRNMDLESAFGNIVEGIDMCAAEIADPTRVVELRTLVVQARTAYKDGRVIEGAHLLQDIMTALGRNNPAKEELTST